MSSRVHQLPGTAVHHVWDNALAPAIEIDPGDVVSVQAGDASGGQILRGSTAADLARCDFSRGNPVSGPVLVKGARPGDVLAVELLELRPGAWGWTAIAPGFGLLVDEFAEHWLRISAVEADHVRFSDRLRVPLRPFPGTVGVAPAEPGEHPLIPPTRWGGNLDTRHLTVGSTLFLPVGVEGALLSIGDPHAAQGDGEVCGSAVETSMEIVMRVSLRRDMAVDAPQLDAAPASSAVPPVRHHVCTGVGPDLHEAARDAARAMVAHLERAHGLDRYEAYALTSVACDLRIHELVDAPNWVVGAFLPEGVVTP